MNWIPQTSPRKLRWITSILCLLGWVANCIFAPTESLAQGKKKSGPSPIVAGQVVKVRRAGVQTFVGTLRAKRQTTIGSAVEGRVIGIFVEEGDPVGSDPDSMANRQEFSGQPLIQLRTGTLDIESGAAEIQLKLVQQALDELSVSLPRDRELLKTAAAEAKARLDFSKSNYDRLKRLGVSATSQGEVEQARSQYLADRQAAKGAEVEYKKLEAVSSLRIQQAALGVAAAKQELARLKDLKEKYTIRTPFTGFVTEKMTEVGEWITRGQPVLEVSQIDPIEMIIDVPQDYLAKLQSGMEGSEAELTAKVAIDGFSETLTGRVKRIIQKADLRSRTFPVRVELDNPKTPHGFLFQPGMLGKASLEVGEPRDMILVKKDALVLGGRQPTVYKIIQDGENTTAIPIPVRTGAAVGQWIQITGRVAPQDRVVLLGNERLRPGQLLRITETDNEMPGG